MLFQMINVSRKFGCLFVCLELFLTVFRYVSKYLRLFWFYVIIMFGESFKPMHVVFK